MPSDFPQLILPPIVREPAGRANWVSTLAIGGLCYVLPGEGLPADGLADLWHRNGILPDINWQQVFKVIRNA